MKFIGHLDLMKLFQRTIKKSQIPIAYSRGFNPHQQMSFAIPLSLGYESHGEYMDIELSKEISPDEIKTTLNSTMPEGILIKKVRKLDNGEKNCAAALTCGIYEVTTEKMDLKNTIDYINASKEIKIEKKTKKGIKEVDIKPYIYDLKDISTEEECKFEATISTGSVDNLKIDILTKYIYDYNKRDYFDYKIKVLRKELLQGDLSLYSKQTR